MTEILSVCAPKQPETKEIPTAPALKFSCYAFADHPPPTRESGQQNENIQDRSRGVRMINGNNKIKKKEKRGEEQKTKEVEQESKKQTLKTLKKPRITWEAKTVEINFVDTPCKEKQLLLEQLARALYDYSCQLAKAKSNLTTEAPSTPELRRTGTDG